MPTAPISAEHVLAGRYRLVQLIASGGMAQVWEAHDDVLARDVAVKILHPHLAADEAFLERFRREAVAAARLAHPDVVATFDTGLEDDVAFIVMELVRGSNLRDLLAEQGALPPARAAKIAAEVADALEYAHQAGVVHRDVKPANILLCDDDRVKVADFGIAKAVADAGDLTQTGQLLGTAKYLSPEQVEGQPLDRRADVYALGLVLYEMLCGRPPFAAPTEMATALQRVEGDPLRPRQVRAGIPRPLEAVVVKAMARARDERYQTAAELRTALLSIDLGDDATAMVVRDATPPGGVVPSFAQTERSWLFPVVLFVLFAVVVGVVGVLLARSPAGRTLFHTTSGASSGGAPVRITAAQAFDPPRGDGHEHDADLPKLFDGNPGTTWSTENYDNSHFGGIKSGVGVVLVLDAPQKVRRIEVTSPTKGWSAQVFVGGGAPPALAGWGPPAATKTGIGGNVTFDIGGRQGQDVLLWITDLGQGNPSVAIGEVRVVA